MSDWDTFFIEMAMHVASKSKDPSTKVGCIIVGPDNEVRSTGYNGFPRGVQELADVRRHAPVEIQRTFAGNGYMVSCTCGDLITLGERRGNWDNLDSLEVHEDPYALRALIETHEHFNAPELQLHPERWERPLKYDYVEHAERNAVYNAARVGIPLKGCRAYLNWEPHPCKECTKAFIQAGIIEVIGPDRPFTTNNDWKFDVSRIMLEESGVAVREVAWKTD